MREELGGQFMVMPWEDFKRVTVRRPVQFRSSDGIQQWEIRLFQESSFSVRDNRAGRTWWTMRRSLKDIIFHVRATEGEATRIIAKLREQFTIGWRPQRDAGLPHIRSSDPAFESNCQS